MSFETTFLIRMENIDTQIKLVQAAYIAESTPKSKQRIQIQQVAIEVDSILASYHIREDRSFILGQEVLNCFDLMKDLMEQLMEALNI